MAIRDYKDLEIWKKGMEVVKDVYRTTSRFPRAETYGLAAQMRRAAVSIPCNVAEGFRRRHNREYRQFLYVSSGSCAELETQLIIARELGYLDVEAERRVADKLNHIARMISSLIKKL